MNTKTPELMPCPFCGGTDVGMRVDKGAGEGMWHRGEDVWYMNCLGCGVRFPGMYAEHGRRSLIERWNTRHFGRTLTNEIGASPEEAAHEAGQAVIDNEVASIKRDSENPG